MLIGPVAEASRYQGAVEAVFAILIGAGLGYWADEHFGSAPRYLVIGVVLGFGAFVLRLLRLGEQMRELSETSGSASSSEADGQTRQRESGAEEADTEAEPR